MAPPAPGAPHGPSCAAGELVWSGAVNRVRAPVTIGIHPVVTVFGLDMPLRAGAAVTMDVHPVLAAFMFQLVMPRRAASRSAPDEEVAPAGVEPG